ncbi:Berberine bridge enzyme-like 26 [Linum grandiflorum]
MKLLPWLIFTLILVSFLSSGASTGQDDFFRCLYSETTTSPDPSNLIFTPNSELYSSVLRFSIQNERFNNTVRLHPIAIITPHTVTQIQSTVLCSRNHGGLQLRVRSGGHDYEGLSYVSSSSEPFLLLDLVNFRNVTVDVPTNSAWVQAGAVLGEVYHGIASASSNLAFPAGICPSVGVGGHISGGGYGMLLRKYGMAADNILDAHLVDAQGRLLDRAAMGEDVFWAIRGGGGNTYGVVVSWKLNLVSIPAGRVTVFSVSRTTEEKGLYVGKTENLMTEMKQRFPELELTEEDCQEMSWIESTIYFSGYPRNASYDVLLDSRSNPPLQIQKFKAKSDYLETVLPLTALQGLWKLLYEIEMGPVTFFQIVPHGGRMSRISDSSIPYPRRAENRYKIQYYAGWFGEDKQVDERHLGWIRRLYKFMRPFVSKKPRGAYANSRDLDLGINNPGNFTSYKQAKVWGKKYYKHNFERLARVKAAIDPANFFRNEQSVPPLFHHN